MAIHGCHLDYICNLLQTQAAKHTCQGVFLIGSFEVGRPTLNVDHMRSEDPPKPRPHLGPYKGHGRRKVLLLACWPSLSLTSSFILLQKDSSTGILA